MILDTILYLPTYRPHSLAHSHSSVLVRERVDITRGAGELSQVAVLVAPTVVVHTCLFQLTEIEYTMGQKKSKPTFKADPNGDGTLPKPAPAPAAKVEAPAPVAAPATAEPAPAPVKEDLPAHTEQTPVESSKPVEPAPVTTEPVPAPVKEDSVAPEPVETAEPVESAPVVEKKESAVAPEPVETSKPVEPAPVTAEPVSAPVKEDSVAPEPVETAEPVESAPVVEKKESADDVSVDAAPVLVSSGAGNVVETSMGTGILLDRRSDGVDVVELGWQLANNSKAVLYKSSDAAPALASAGAGEVVETSMGTGILLDRRSDGVDVVELGWQLANNSKAVLYKSSPSAGPVPIGHTEFSWKSKGPASIPIGHTEFTWK
jgi:hypothetical protein